MSYATIGFSFRVLAAALLLVSAGAVAGVVLEEDPPLAAPAAKGDIAGRLADARDVAEIHAVVRDGGKRIACDEFDRASGKFLFNGLSGDTTYDICLKLGDGRVVEGIDLDFADSRLLRLAQLRRKQLKLPDEPVRAFTDQDAQDLQKYVEGLKANDFMDKGRALYIAGYGRRATMLVELMRTGDFHAQKKDAGGKEVIWRIELWYFENVGGGWQRVANQERVLRRERVSVGEWRKISVQYVPQLSVHIDAMGKSSPVQFGIPQKVDASVGRPAGSEPDLKTKPQVLGVAPTTLPGPASE